MTSFPKEKGFYQVRIHEWAKEGETAARLRNVPIYVPHGIPGEKVKVQVTEVFRNFSRANIDAVLEASDHRVSVPCEYFSTCGGCQWQHVDSEAQLEAKRRSVEKNFFRYESLKDCLVLPVIPSPAPYHYRNKFQVPIAKSKGRAVGGFYYPRTHQLTALNDCQVQSALTNEIYREILHQVNALQVEPYDEKRHEGILRSCIIREGFFTGEVMVIFVTRSESFPKSDELTGRLLKKFSSIVSVMHNIQPAKTNVFLGSDSKVLAGKSFFHEKILDWIFQISWSSFFQINSPQVSSLIEVVSRMAELKRGEKLLDLYCGAGLLSIALSPGASEVLGLEANAQAVEDARVNAAANRAGNVRFETCNIENELIEKIKTPYDVVIVDPPRQGLQKSVIQNISQLKIPKMIYVSCDPESLAHDLDKFVENGYKLEEAQPIDLFPQTYHVETVARLTLL